MSDANSLKIAVIPEVTYAVTPTSGAIAQVMRITSEDFKKDTKSVRSNEIRADRATADITRTQVGAVGGFRFELSYGSFDVLIKSGLLADADWTASVTETSADFGTLAVSIPSSVNTIIRTTGNWGAQFVALAGKWVRFTLFANAGNNGYFKVLTGGGTATLTVAGALMTVEGATATPTSTTGSAVTAGVGGSGGVADSYSISKAFTDLTSEFVADVGMCVNTINLSLTTGNIITGSFAFLGSNEASATALPGTVTYVAATTTSPMNTVDHVIAMNENHSALGETEYTFQLDNNLRQRYQIGASGAVSIGKGSIVVKGTIKGYYATKTLADKYRNWTATKLSLILRDSDGNAYVIDIPRVRITAAVVNATAKDTDCYIDAQFEAYLDPTEVKTFRWLRWAA